MSKRRAMSLLLALVMCLGVTAPAFAAETKEVREDISLTGIVGEEMVEASPVGIQLYELEFPSTLVISGCGKTDEYFFARKARIAASIYEAVQNGSEEPADWDWSNGPFIPGEWRYGEEIANLEWTENGVYTFERTLAGKTVFLYLVEEWESIRDGGGNGLPSAGTTTLLLRFPNKQPSVPTIVSTGVNPEASGTAYASTQAVNVDGKAVEFQMYALKNANGDPTNYVKLRDVADVLDGTAAQFNVTWAEETGVGIQTKTAYSTRTGQEGKTPYSGDRSYQKGADTTQIDGTAVPLQAFFLTDDNGGDHTYYKLRDLGQALGFNVGYDAATDTVFIETNKPYDSNN